MQIQVIELTSERKALFRRKFEQLEEVTPFNRDIKLASQIACYGMLREIGTANDELARFIFDNDTKKPIDLGSLKAELVEWNNMTGLRVYSTASQKLELRAKSFYDVVHPSLSKNQDGTLHSLFIFPEIINAIAAIQGVELVLVKSWGLNSIFGGFDPAKSYYQTNFWELENNDSLRFADLIRKDRLAFLGTHDLIAHIAGVNHQHWLSLRINAEKVYNILEYYFKSVPKPSIASLILPYTIGVVLDDLAQPPSYNSKSHRAVLERLMEEILKNKIPANLPTLLTRFPEYFQKTVELSRSVSSVTRPFEIDSVVSGLTKEILEASLVYVN